MYFGFVPDSMMGEPKSTSPGFSVGGSTPDFCQEDFSAGSRHARLPGEDSRVAHLTPYPAAGGIIAMQSFADLLTSCSGVLADDAVRAGDEDFPSGTTRGTQSATAQNKTRQTLSSSRSAVRVDTVLCANNEGAAGAGSSAGHRALDSGSIVDLDSGVPWVMVDWTAGSVEHGATDVGESDDDGVVLGSPKKK